MAENKAQVVITGDSTGAVDAVKKAAAAVEDGMSKMKKSLESVGSAFETIQKHFAAFAALMAGGSAFKESIEATVKFTGEVLMLSKRMGVTTEEASKMNVALKLIGASAEDYSQTITFLNRQVRTNEQALKDAGLATRTVNGEYKDQKTLIDDALKTMMQYKEGTDRNLAAQALFGRGAAEATKLLKLNAETLAEAEKLTKAYGMAVGNEGVASVKEFKLGMNAMKVALEAIEDAIGKAVLPMFIKLGQWFRGEGVGAVVGAIRLFEFMGEVVTSLADLVGELYETVKNSFNAISDAIHDALGKSGEDLHFFENFMRGLKIVVEGFKLAISLVFDGIALAADNLASTIRTAGAMIQAALSWDWDGIKTAWAKGVAEIEANYSAAADRMVAKATKSAEEMSRIALGDKAESPGKAAAAVSKGGSKSWQGKDTTTKDPSRMGEWQNELNDLKIKYQLENDLREMSKAQEMAYWTQIKATHKTTREETIALDRKIAEEQLAILHHAKQQREGLNLEQVEAQKKMGLAIVSLDEQQAKFQVDLGKMTNAELIAQKVAFENRKFEIEREALDRRKGLTDPSTDPVAYQKLADEIETLAITHGVKMQAIQNEAALEAGKDWKSFFASLSSGFTNVLQQVAQGTATMASTVKSVLQTVMNAVGGLITTMTQKWLEGLFIQKSATAATASTEIGAHAAVAGAAAAESQAGIPIVGPALALAAMAGITTAVLAQRSVASASGGYDIPASVNPLTQLHAKEMVLPADIAEPMRAQYRNGEGGGAVRDVNISIHALDGASVKNVLMSNTGALASAMKAAVRNGALPS